MIGFARAGWEEEAGSKTRRRWPELWAGSSSSGAGKRWRHMRSWEVEPPGPGDLTGRGGVKSRKGVACGSPSSDWLVVSLTNSGNPKEAFGGWETSSVGAGVGAGTRAHVLRVSQFPSFGFFAKTESTPPHAYGPSGEFGVTSPNSQKGQDWAKRKIT